MLVSRSLKCVRQGRGAWVLMPNTEMLFRLNRETGYRDLVTRAYILSTGDMSRLLDTYLVVPDESLIPA